MGSPENQGTLASQYADWGALSSVVVWVALLLGAGAFAQSQPLPAFPGAEGFGSHTPGGRGGRVIAVTNLNDSGPGSLREACTAPGARIVVFRVGGTIRLQSHLRITEPFITIAGQTAPGDGILLRDAGLYIETHDVVVRFLRVRIGPSLVEKYNTQDPLHIEGENCYNVIVDHCSFSWSIDECSSVRGPAHDVTLSWLLVGEALRTPLSKAQIEKERAHSMGIILGGNPDRCTLHHNLFTHCDSRNPRIQGGRHAFVNNVVYDWTWLTGTFSRDPEVNFIGNYYKPGNFSLDLLPIAEKAGQMGRIYVRDNWSPRRTSGELGFAEQEWDETVSAPASLHQATEPFAMPAVTTSGPHQAYAEVLAQAGAVLPRRDAVDTRLVRQVRLGQGTTISDPDEVGGYPLMRGGPAPADRDGDGMPDDWETAHGLDPDNPDDCRSDADGDGYTNIEAYLEGLVSAWKAEHLSCRAIGMDTGAERGTSLTPYALRIAGEPVSLEPFGEPPSLYLARVRISGGPAAEASLSNATLAIAPKRYAAGSQNEGNMLRFQLDEPGPRLVFAVSDATRAAPLLLLAESWESRAPLVEGESDIVRVTPTGSESLLTATLQAALDAAADETGARVVRVEPGTHRTGPVRISSQTTLWLPEGTTLLAENGPSEPLLLLARATDAQILGPGVIRGRHHSGPLIAADGCRNVTVEAVFLREVDTCGIQLHDCTDVRVSGVSILAASPAGSAQGLTIDGCRRVWVDRLWALCGGQAIAVRAAQDATCEIVRVHDAVLVSKRAAIHLGEQARGTLAAMLFHDIDIVRSVGGLAVDARDGALVRSVTFRDVHMALHERPGDPHSGIPVRIVAQSGTSSGRIADILVERATISAPGMSVVSGGETAWASDIRFWGCSWAPTARTGGLRPLVRMRYVDRPELRFTTVDWTTGVREQWTGLLDAAEVRNLRVTETKEIGG